MPCPYFAMTEPNLLSRNDHVKVILLTRHHQKLPGGFMLNRYNLITAPSRSPALSAIISVVQAWHILCHLKYGIEWACEIMCGRNGQHWAKSGVCKSDFMPNYVQRDELSAPLHRVDLTSSFVVNHPTDQRVNSSMFKRHNPNRITEWPGRTLPVGCTTCDKQNRETKNKNVVTGFNANSKSLILMAGPREIKKARNAIIKYRKNRFCPRKPE